MKNGKVLRSFYEVIPYLIERFTEIQYAMFLVVAKRILLLFMKDFALDVSLYVNVLIEYITCTLLLDVGFFIYFLSSQSDGLKAVLSKSFNRVIC